MRKVSENGSLQVFKIGSVIAACSDDTEVSRKAVLDYLMSVQEDMYVPFMFQNLTDEEKRITLEKRVFGIKEGGAYFL